MVTRRSKLQTDKHVVAHKRRRYYVTSRRAIETRGGGDFVTGVDVVVFGFGRTEYWKYGGRL